MNPTANELPRRTRWQRISRFVSVLLIICGVWLALSNVWRLSRLSREAIAIGTLSSESTTASNRENSPLLDAPLFTGDFPSEREVEGFWQFAGARIGIGLRSSSNTELNQETDGFDSAPPCEELDLTDFVRGLEELIIPYEEFSGNGLASRRFKYRSSEFSAWLVVSRMDDRWKFCAGGIEYRDQAGETTGVRAVTIARESGPWGMLDSFGLKLPFTTELVGTRFNSEREPIGVLLVASLSLAQIEAKLRQAGHKFSKNLEFASEVWTTTLEMGGNADIYGCRVVQLGPSRCVIMVTKEPS